jgi:hypothetical protein
LGKCSHIAWLYKTLVWNRLHLGHCIVPTNTLFNAKWEFLAHNPFGDLNHSLIYSLKVCMISFLYRIQVASSARKARICIVVGGNCMNERYA